MRVKFDNRIWEVDWVSIPGGNNRFIHLHTPNGLYAVDCETPDNTQYIYNKLFMYGYLDASQFDRNNDLSDASWFEYCLNKTKE